MNSTTRRRSFSFLAIAILAVPLAAQAADEGPESKPGSRAAPSATSFDVIADRVRAAALAAETWRAGATPARYKDAVIDEWVDGLFRALREETGEALARPPKTAQATPQSFDARHPMPPRAELRAKRGLAVMPYCMGSVLLVDGDARISHATGSLIVATGSATISHAKSCVVIVGGALSISHVDARREGEKDFIGLSTLAAADLIDCSTLHGGTLVLGAAEFRSAFPSRAHFFGDGVRTLSNAESVRSSPRAPDGLPKKKADPFGGRVVCRRLDVKDDPKKSRATLAIGDEEAKAFAEGDALGEGDLKSWRVSLISDGFVSFRSESATAVLKIPPPKDGR
jgi:hypothetical protein